MVSKSTRLKLLLAVIACAASGCTALPATQATRPTAGTAAGEAGRSEANRTEAAPRNEASVALLTASRAASAIGDHGTAAATLERAVAIDPNNAELWIELAGVRSRQGDCALADSLARKALSVAGADRGIERRAAALIDGC